MSRNSGRNDARGSPKNGSEVNKKTMKLKTFTIQGKQYKTTQVIGEGSHAHVWCARATSYPHDEITIKIAKEDDVAKQRVQNEIRFLKEVQHSNIPELLESGVGPTPWFAMPLLEKLHVSIPKGGQLQKYDISDTREKGYPSQASSIPFEYRQKVAIAALVDISSVIAYISGTNIVHADINPTNILASGSLIKKNYLLTDWGATALIHEYPDSTFGTLQFTAPERLFGEVSIKSDLFSLGVTIFYILTGKVPYQGKNGEEYYTSIIMEDNMSPCIFEKKTISSLDRLIRELIQKKPENRPGAPEAYKRIEKISAKYL